MDNEGGDCYVVALNLVLGFSEIDCPFESGDLLLCHGTATGTGNGIKGRKFGHAWCEFVGDVETLVIDYSNGNRAVLPKPLYYKVGQVCDVSRYTLDEVRRMMIEHKHYGPWEGEFATPAEEISNA